MKKSKFKNSKGKYRHPLTFFDKCIYGIGFLFLILMVLLLGFLTQYLTEIIAFSNPNIVAYRSHGSFLLALPLLLYFEVGGMIALIAGFTSKKPIFGSKKYNYGEFPFKEDCIPLLRRKKYNLKKSPAEKKFKRKIAMMCCAFFLFSACLYPLGLFGRNILYLDNHIEQINVFNCTSDTYTTEDFVHLTIKTHRAKKISSPWTYEIEIKMKDGKTISFSNQYFTKNASSRKDFCLDKMLEIKALFKPELITIQSSKNITEIADTLGFNESQKAKFYELFSN